MDRRAFLGALGLLPAPLVAAAQEPGKVYRIGFLRSGHPPDGYIAALQQGLREHGYVPGQNVVIELRATDGSADQLPRLAEELIRMRVDVVLMINRRIAQSLGLALPPSLLQRADQVIE